MAVKTQTDLDSSFLKSRMIPRWPFKRMRLELAVVSLSTEAKKSTKMQSNLTSSTMVIATSVKSASKKYINVVSVRK